MGLRKKKKKNNEFNGINHATSITAFDKIAYKVINVNSDELLYSVCDCMLDGHPVLIKFEKIENEVANRMLAFISGVLYATDGKIFKIETRLFLIARKEEFEDGTLLQYIEDQKC